MNRRDALSRVALLLGGAIVGAETFLSGCTTADKKFGAGTDFTADDIAFLNEVAETIIPATSTPGAKDANVGEFMARIVKDCYGEKDQQIFLVGMGKLDAASKTRNRKPFLDCDAKQRHDLLLDLDKEQKDYMSKKTHKEPTHYFRMMKELTLWGYFTSEPGATKSLRYLPVPGRYEGCLPYKKGDKAWAI